MKRVQIQIILAAALLSGCGSVPMTHQEYREAIKQTSMATKETFDVKRPFADVARSFQKKAPECLSYRLKLETRLSNGTRQTAYEQGKPTVVASKERIEVYFQAKVTPSGNIAQEPPDGYYLLLAEAYPLSKTSTKVDIYRARVEVVAQAIKAWAAGQEQGCPDPTRVFPR